MAFETHELSIFDVTEPRPDSVVAGFARDITLVSAVATPTRAELMTRIGLGDLLMRVGASSTTELPVTLVGVFETYDKSVLIVRSPVPAGEGIVRYLALVPAGEDLRPGTRLRAPARLQSNNPELPRQSYIGHGTLIETPYGPRPIEGLVVGDLVQTFDSGIQPICWIGNVSLRESTLERFPELRPVSIAAGVLSPGVPQRRVLLAPQQHVLVSGLQSVLGFNEGFVAARDLVGLPGVRSLVPRGGLHARHILLKSHQVLLAAGMPTESFYPDPSACLSFGAEAVRATRDVAGLDPGQTYGPMARVAIDRALSKDIIACLRLSGGGISAVA